MYAALWLAAVPFARPQQKPDFRQTHWGMTKAEVRAVEKNKPRADAEDDTYLVYRDSVEDLNCLVGYLFINDQLVRALYVVDQNHADPIGYLSDYQHLRRALTEKYGQPAKDDEVWSNDLYKDKPQEYGKAVAAGHLKRFTVWETDTTEINIFLTGKNSKIDLSVDYSSTRLADLKNRAERTAQGVLNSSASVHPAR